MIPHRFTGGGMLVEKLWSPRADRIRLQSVPATAYFDNRRASRRQRIAPGHGQRETPSVFRVGDAEIRFRAMLHRQIPEGAVINGEDLRTRVKRVAWCGRIHPVTRRWAWRLAITVEEPGMRSMRADASVVGLDLGWRRLEAVGATRIGMMWDGQRAVELRLPDDAPTAHTRRHGLPSSWGDVDDLVAKRAKLLDDVKGLIRPWFQVVPAGYAEMRQGGLRRLLQSVEQSTSPDPMLRSALHAWQREDRHLAMITAAVRDRLISRREWLYGNVAAWLCRYGTIAWEKDLGVKAMAEAEDMTPAIKASMRLRHRAAIGRFRQILKSTATRLGTRLVDVDPAGTTTACHVCGGMIDNTGATVLICAAGHASDQDVNAAINLRSQIGGDSERDGALRNGGGVSVTERVEIPEILRAVAIKVHAG
jgi:hypothetical protein